MFSDSVTGDSSTNMDRRKEAYEIKRKKYLEEMAAYEKRIRERTEQRSQRESEMAARLKAEEEELAAARRKRIHDEEERMKKHRDELEKQEMVIMGF